MALSRLCEKKYKMENEELLIDVLKKDLQIDPATKISFEKIKEKLIAHINDLINNNFEELKNLYSIYRVDVSEAKLKTLLKRKFRFKFCRQPIIAFF